MSGDPWLDRPSETVAQRLRLRLGVILGLLFLAGPAADLAHRSIAPVRLALLAAVIAGVVPALKATGKRVQRGLQYFGTRANGAQLGPMWTAMIVLQVAVAVALLPPAFYNGAQFFSQASKRPAVGANGLVRATIGFSREGRADGPLGIDARLPELTNALTQRLDADPEIAAVTEYRDTVGALFQAAIEGGSVKDTIKKANEAFQAILDKEK